MRGLEDWVNEDATSHRGPTVVLIIDETHLLKVGPIEEIRLLANFKMDSLTRSH